GRGNRVMGAASAAITARESRPTRISRQSEDRSEEQGSLSPSVGWRLGLLDGHAQQAVGQRLAVTVQVEGAVDAPFQHAVDHEVHAMQLRQQVALYPGHAAVSEQVEHAALGDLGGEQYVVAGFKGKQ